jgi:hypothetical protein
MSIKPVDDRHLDMTALVSGLENLDLEDLDPNLGEGFKIIFDREIPIELRLQDNNTGAQEAGTLESIKTKIMIQGELQNPSVLKMELTSESDLFFNYVCVVEDNSYAKMRDEQKLNIDMNGLPNLLIKIFNNCQKDPNTYFAVLFITGDGPARLDFIQNLEYKFLELLTLDFAPASEEAVRQNITFRYNVMKAKCNYLQDKLKQVSELVKLKNPSLLLHLQKGTTPMKSGGHSMYSAASKKHL